MSTFSKEELRERLGNIDQIRDIIFGAQLRDYDNRLGQMESNLSLLQQDLRDRIEQMKNSLSGELRIAIESLEKKMKSAQSSTEEETADLRQQVDRLNRKFSKSIQTLDEIVDAQTSALRQEIIQTQKNYQDEVMALRSLVLDELEKRFSDLRAAKVSKDDLAETLLALGMRLKGTEFIPQLQEVAHKEEEAMPLLMARKVTTDPNVSHEV
jgi:hypothetical protein